MVSVKFVQANGIEREIDIGAGISAMEGAVRAGVDGIDADCGGALSCATCHVRVAPEWLDRLTPPAPDELEMLEFAVDGDETSRLSCQIHIAPGLDGLVLHIPAAQR